jgi:periplasmic copper chaperone A
MKPRPSCGGRGFFVFALGWMLLACTLGAAETLAQTSVFQAGSIQVDAIRAAPTPPVASVAAVYLSITNRGATSDRLIALESPIAAKVELHRSTMAQGIMQMREVAALDCPPRAIVKIEPGALHIMLTGLRQPLVAGTTFSLSLKFRDAGMLVVQVPVKSPE